MQTIDPALVTAPVAMCVGALMVHAGVAKRQLAWRSGGRIVTGDGGGDAADNDRRCACASRRLRSPMRLAPPARADPALVRQAEQRARSASRTA